MNKKNSTKIGKGERRSAGLSSRSDAEGERLKRQVTSSTSSQQQQQLHMPPFPYRREKMGLLFPRKKNPTLFRPSF